MPRRRDPIEPLSESERQQLQALVDNAGGPLPPAASREEGLKLLRTLQYWLGASPLWWGRPQPAFDGKSPWDFILDGGDPQRLLDLARTQHPLD